jgi:hypothetical protein
MQIYVAHGKDCDWLTHNKDAIREGTIPAGEGLGELCLYIIGGNHTIAGQKAAIAERLRRGLIDNPKEAEALAHHTGGVYGMMTPDEAKLVSLC